MGVSTGASLAIRRHRARPNGRSQWRQRKGPTSRRTDFKRRSSARRADHHRGHQRDPARGIDGGSHSAAMAPRRASADGPHEACRRDLLLAGPSGPRGDRTDLGKGAGETTYGDRSQDKRSGGAALGRLVDTPHPLSPLVSPAIIPWRPENPDAIRCRPPARPASVRPGSANRNQQHPARSPARPERSGRMTPIGETKPRSSRMKGLHRLEESGHARVATSGWAEHAVPRAIPRAGSADPSAGPPRDRVGMGTGEAAGISRQRGRRPPLAV